MAYVDEIKTASGLTVKDPSGTGPATYNDNREWAYVLRGMKECLAKLSKVAMEDEDPTDVDPVIAEFVREVQEWNRSFDPDWANPEFLTTPVMTWSSSFEIMDDQMGAVRNGAALIERGVDIAGVEVVECPGVVHRQKDPPGFLDKALVAGVVIGVAFLGVRIYEASKKGGKKSSSPLALP